jgi:hypothetical protein
MTKLCSVMIAASRREGTYVEAVGSAPWRVGKARCRRKWPIKVVQVIIKDSSSSSKGLALLTAFTAAFLSLIEDLCNGAGRHKVSILCVLLAI